MDKRTAIAALLRERRGYATHGRADRVAEVDAELVKLGYTKASRAGRRVERAVSKPTETRGR